MSDFKNAVSIQPKNAEAHYWMASIKLTEKQCSTALSYINQSIETNPNVSEAHLLRGNAYHCLGNKDDAIENWKAAARMGNKNVQKFLESKKITW